MVGTSAQSAGSGGDGRYCRYAISRFREWSIAAAAAAGRGDRVVTVAQRDAAVRCAKGLRVLPDASFDAATRTCDL